MIDPELTYLRLMPNGPLPPIEDHDPFRAVVVIDSDYTPQWQEEVCRWLVDSGCRYMLAWGPGCESFHDAVDDANIMKFHPKVIPDNEFVMTTWHTDETLESVFWDAQFIADQSYDGTQLVNTLIVHVGDVDQEDSMRSLFEQSKTLADREPD